MKENRLDASLKLIVKTSIVVFIGLLLSKIFMYLYRILIARYFGPEVYGLFSLSFIIAGWFVAFFSFGLSEGLLRYISFYRGKKEIKKITHIFKFALIFSIFSSIFSGVLLFFLSDFISLEIFHAPDLIIFLKTFSILIPLWILSNIFLSAIRAYEKIAWHSFILNILDNAIKLISLVLFILIGIKTNAIIFSFLLGFLVMLLVSYLVSKYKLSGLFRKYKLKKEIRKKIISNLFSYSWPLMFLSFMFLLFLWIDSFTIGYFMGVLEVGIYNAAVPIAFLLNFVPDIFMQLFFPLINKEFSRKNLSLIKELSKQVGKWIFAINLPIFFILILFPGAIISFLFGQEYIMAETSLRFLAVGIFFSSIFRVSNFLLSMIGKSRLMLGNIVLTSLINLILNVLLIPRYGINGAAFSTMVSFILLSLILLFEANHYTSIIPLRKKMIRVLLVSFAPLIIILYLKKLFSSNFISLILQGALFLFLYIFLILITGCLDKHDFMILKNIKKKIIQ